MKIKDNFKKGLCCLIALTLTITLSACHSLENISYLMLTQTASSRKSMQIAEIKPRDEPVHNHNYIVTGVKATCTTEGYSRFTCRDCDYEYIKITEPPKNHSFSLWITKVEAQCEKAGEAYRVCALCPIRETQEIPALEHNYETEIIAPTCTETGFTKYKCKICAAEYVDEETSKLNHTMLAWTVEKAPSCQEKGTQIRKCKDCGEIQREEIPEIEHSYKITKVSPTCTTEGYTKFVCSCGHEEISELIPKTAHNYSEWILIKSPTDISTGIERRTCTVCSVFEDRKISN